MDGCAEGVLLLCERRTLSSQSVLWIERNERKIDSHIRVYPPHRGDVHVEGLWIVHNDLLYRISNTEHGEHRGQERSRDRTTLVGGATCPIYVSHPQQPSMPVLPKRPSIQRHGHQTREPCPSPAFSQRRYLPRPMVDLRRAEAFLGRTTPAPWSKAEGWQQ